MTSGVYLGVSVFVSWVRLVKLNLLQGYGSALGGSEEITPLLSSSKVLIVAYMSPWSHSLLKTIPLITHLSLLLLSLETLIWINGLHYMPRACFLATGKLKAKMWRCLLYFCKHLIFNKVTDHFFLLFPSITCYLLSLPVHFRLMDFHKG